MKAHGYRPADESLVRDVLYWINDVIKCEVGGQTDLELNKRWVFYETFMATTPGSGRLERYIVDERSECYEECGVMVVKYRVRRV